MTITNQKPITLSPVHTPNVNNDFDPIKSLRETLVEPLFEPITPNVPVTMTNNNKTIDAYFITEKILECCQPTVNTASEDFVKELFSKTLLTFNNLSTLSVQETFLIQASTKENLPVPTAKIVYLPAIDIIPTCKEFIAGKCSQEKLFASIGFYTRVQTLGFYFTQESEFDEFKTWFLSQTNAISSVLPVDTNQMITQFMNLKLDGLTESLILRNKDSDNNDPLSFARILPHYLFKYANSIQSSQFGCMPFDVGELFCPKTIIFINIANHARATASEIHDEWEIIKNSLKNKIKILSYNKIQKLTSAARQVYKIQQQMANAATNSKLKTQKANIQRFKKIPPTSADIVRYIKQILNKMTFVQQSHNIFKNYKTTYQKPNRRDPDDFNKPGKLVAATYKPDLHVYLDTSGSVTESDYQLAVTALIRMARKLNVSLYFNSFSHELSQCTLLKTKDKSISEVYKIFQKIPKVTGGTDYAQIWDYINISPKRKRELSLVLTDFEYYAPHSPYVHPKNLYYLPFATHDWKNMCKTITKFCDSMKYIDPNCKSRILC